MILHLDTVSFISRSLRQQNDCQDFNENFLVAPGSGLDPGLSAQMEDKERSGRDAGHHGQRGEGLRGEGQTGGRLCAGDLRDADCRAPAGG